MQSVWDLVVARFWALKGYVATHVLGCLMPGFLLADAMVVFINQQAILNLRGETDNQWKSFSLISVASFFVAACSCTVILGTLVGWLFGNYVAVFPEADGL